VARRGRPPKPPSDADLRKSTCADPLTDEQRERLRLGLDRITAVKRLDPHMRAALLDALAETLPYHVVASNVRPQTNLKRRGPKPRIELTTTLVDCTRAWEIATGDKLKLWATPSEGTEAVPCQIARVAIQVLNGLNDPYQGSFHRQIAAANKVLANPETFLA
jgi:hypothetical protein